jgi:hypothetical protein
MKVALLLVVSIPVVGAHADENQKLAQAGFHFLTVTSDARGAAMADAMTSLSLGSSALFFNPAGMASMDHFIDISASTNKWIADIKHYGVGAAIAPFDGDYGVLGFSFQYVDYGTFIRTVVRKDLEVGYQDLGLFKLYALAIGVGYAKQLSERFSIGGQIRWARQDLGESTIPNTTPQVPILDSLGNPTGRYTDTSSTATNRLTPLVFDFGTQFKTGIKSLVFGMSIRNFSGDMQYAYEPFQLPLIFTLGVSMDVLDVVGRMDFDHSLLVSIDASHFRDQPEQIKVAMEYDVMHTLDMRVGYKSQTDESGWSFGLGLRQFGLGIDYAYTPYGIFGSVQRLTARFSY